MKDEAIESLVRFLEPTSKGYDASTCFINDEPYYKATRDGADIIFSRIDLGSGENLRYKGLVYFRVKKRANLFYTSASCLVSSELILDNPQLAVGFVISSLNKS